MTWIKATCWFIFNMRVSASVRGLFHCLRNLASSKVLDINALQRQINDCHTYLRFVLTIAKWLSRLCYLSGCHCEGSRGFWGSSCLTMLSNWLKKKVDFTQVYLCLSRQLTSWLVIPSACQTRNQETKLKQRF